MVATTNQVAQFELAGRDHHQFGAGLSVGQGVAKHRAIRHGLGTEAQTDQQVEQTAHQPGGQFS